MTPDDIADYFILKEKKPNGEPITKLDLQKITFCAHGLYLAMKGQKLVDEDFRAWQHGPVLKSLIDRFYDFGKEPLTKDLAKSKNPERKVSAYERSFLEHAWRIFGNLKTNELYDLGHDPKGPWAAVRKEHGKSKHQSSDIAMSNAAIREYFEERIKAEGRKLKASLPDDETMRDLRRLLAKAKTSKKDIQLVNEAV